MSSPNGCACWPGWSAPRGARMMHGRARVRAWRCISAWAVRHRPSASWRSRVDCSQPRAYRATSSLPPACSARPFLAAREFLLDQREDLAAANAEFEWPALDEFNWALDYFDTLSADATALWLINADGSEERRSFGELSERSNRVANYLRDLGARRSDRILMVLANSVPLWETMLAAMKLGAVLIPATTLLTSDDMRDRIERGQVKVVVTASELA